MNGAYISALEFLHGAGRITDVVTLENTFSSAVSAFGYKYFACMHVADRGKPIATRLLAGRTDVAWDAYYLETGYLLDDPCVPALFSLSRPYSWSEMRPRSFSRRAIQMFAEAADAGLAEGLIIPVHGVLGDLKAVRLLTDQAGLDDEARPILHAISVVFADRATTLVEVAQDASIEPPLTRRERECLHWVGEAKSDWEIGAILGIAQTTAHEHIENAKRKLGCTRRMQAWSKAASRGWLLSPP